MHAIPMPQNRQSSAPITDICILSYCQFQIYKHITTNNATANNAPALPACSLNAALLLLVAAGDELVVDDPPDPGVVPDVLFWPLGVLELSLGKILIAKFCSATPFVL